MSASEAQICNLALIKYGDKTISSLEDESKEGRACKILYPLMRDEMTYSHPWNFAMHRADISAELADTPAFGYDFAYQLPPDCLRVWELSGTDSKWEVESGKLLTDQEEEIFIRYLLRVTQTGFFSPAYVNALATRLAAELAAKLSDDWKKRANLMQELALEVLPEARRLNALEGNPKQHKDQQPLDKGNYTWQGEGR